MAGEHDDAVDAFEVMLLKIAESPNPDVQRELHPRSRAKLEDDLFASFDRVW